MAIYKVYTMARLSYHFISNESNDEDINIFNNSYKTVGLLDSDSHKSPLPQADNSDTDIKSEEDLGGEDLKIVYLLARVVYNDTHVYDVAIGAINSHLEEPSDMRHNLIYHADEAQMLHSEHVILNNLVSSGTVGGYGPTLGRCVLTS